MTLRDEKSPHVFPVHSAFILTEEREKLYGSGWLYVHRYKFRTSLGILKKKDHLAEFLLYSFIYLYSSH